MISTGVSKKLGWINLGFLLLACGTHGQSDHAEEEPPFGGVFSADGPIAMSPQSNMPSGLGGTVENGPSITDDDAVGFEATGGDVQLGDTRENHAPHHAGSASPMSAETGGRPVEGVPPPEIQRFPEGARAALVLGHRFAAMVGEPGTTISRRWYREDDTFSEEDGRIDLGFRPVALFTVPGRQIVLVGGEDGQIVSVRIDGGQLQILSQFDLPTAGLSQFRYEPTTDQVLAIVKNPTDGGGVYGLRVNEAGRIGPAAPFKSLLLAQTVAHDPNIPGRLAVVGGQVLFEPIDQRDIRTWRIGANGFEEENVGDVFQDIMEISRVMVSPDGRSILVGNHSLFSDEYGVLLHLSWTDDGFSELNRWSMLGDLRSIRPVPNSQSFWISAFEDGKLYRFEWVDDRVEQRETVSDMGLIEDFIFLRRKDGQHRAIIPSVHPADGSRIGLFEPTEEGLAKRIVWWQLPDGAQHIPGPMTVIMPD